MPDAGGGELRAARNPSGDSLTPRACPEIRRDRDQIAPGIREAMSRAIAAARWPLVLVGGVGTGKTCAALCVMDHLKAFAYWTADELSSTLAAAKMGELWYPGGGKRTPEAIWHDIASYRCVCLDELGARSKITDNAYEAVKTTLDKRAGKPAVFISNLGFNELAQLYDTRVVSRLAAGSLIVFEGRDRRLDR